MRSSHKGQGSAIDLLYLSPLHYSIARLQYYTELYGQVELKPPILCRLCPTSNPQYEFRSDHWPGSSKLLLLQMNWIIGDPSLSLVTSYLMGEWSHEWYIDAKVHLCTLFWTLKVHNIQYCIQLKTLPQRCTVHSTQWLNNNATPLPCCAWTGLGNPLHDDFSKQADNEQGSRVKSQHELCK